MWSHRGSARRTHVGSSSHRYSARRPSSDRHRLRRWPRHPKRKLAFAPARFAEPLLRDLERLGAQIVAAEIALVADRSDADGARAHERIDHELTRIGALLDQHLAHFGRLLGGVAVVDARYFDDVGDAEIVQLALALLEEQDALVTRAIVVAHADLAVVRHDAVCEEKQLVAMDDRDIDEIMHADVLESFDADRGGKGDQSVATVREDRARAHRIAGTQGRRVAELERRAQEAVIARGDQLAAVGEL